MIGADGSNSTVRRLVGEPANHGRALAVAIRGYAPTPAGAPNELSIRWDSQRAGGLCYAWAFPIADGTTNVGYGMSSAAPNHNRAHLEKRLAELLPEYDLTGVELTGHTLPLTVARPKPAIGRVLLVGDAASLINPFTGEGIYSAIASGVMAGVAALGADAASVYAAALKARFRQATSPDQVALPHHRLPDRAEHRHQGGTEGPADVRPPARSRTRGCRLQRRRPRSIRALRVLITFTSALFGVWRALGAVGSAPRSHRGGQEFKSPRVHQRAPHADGSTFRSLRLILHVSGRGSLRSCPGGGQR